MRRRVPGEAILLAVVVTGVAWAVAHPAWWVLVIVFGVWFLIGAVLR